MQVLSSDMFSGRESTNPLRRLRCASRYSGAVFPEQKYTIMKKVPARYLLFRYNCVIYQGPENFGYHCNLKPDIIDCFCQGAVKPLGAGEACQAMGKAGTICRKEYIEKRS
jgi:hypothetical protein